MASSGTADFLMRLSVVARTGTLKCISIFAAAEEAIALGASFLASSPSAGAASTTGSLVDCSGMVMVSPQVGQGMSEPAPSASTANSCSQCGQLKIISINGK